MRSLFHNVRSRAHFMTATIQPPLLAWAWRIAVGERQRALDGDGLVWIIQPDESGLDASRHCNDTPGEQVSHDKRLALLLRLTRVNGV